MVTHTPNEYVYTNNYRMIELKISISTSKWFDTQRQVANFLDIKNSSKTAIESRCRQWGYEVEFDK